MARDAISTLTGSATDGTQTHVTGTQVGAKRGLDVVVLGGAPIADLNWDALDVQQTSSLVETYLFYTGGLAGTLVATCTVTYVTATKDDLNTVVWS